MFAQTKTIAIPKLLFWSAAACCVALTSYLVATQPSLWAIIMACTLLVAIVSKNLRIGLAIVVMLPVAGELIRLPFGGENGALISDLAISILIGIWILKKIASREAVIQSRFTKPLLAFAIVAVFSLLFSLTFLSFSQVLASSLYLVRFIEYAMLALLTLDSVKNPKQAKRLLGIITVSACLLAIAGFIQLIIYPNLDKLESFGWDPHHNRLVSTWLDPNFMAGMLSFVIAILAGITIHIKGALKKISLLLIIGMLATALFLTYSRSGYIAIAIAIFVIGALKSRKLLIACVVIAITAVILLPRAQERIDQLSQSVNSIVFNTSQNPDPTAKLRIQSWNQTLDLIAKRPILGSGYNTLPFVKFEEGLVSNPQVHSASGSDSSLLTILATTGILGLIPFILLYWRMLALAWKNWRSRNIPGIWRGLSLGILAGIIGLFAHSLFVNSLLYPEIMIFVWTCTGLLDRINTFDAA